MRIKHIYARQVLDSRGNPTVEVELSTRRFKVRSIVPSGASTGKHEALELRDKKEEYLGKSVMKAVKNVNKIIAPKIKGMKCTKQSLIDDLMILLDGTLDKSKLGANAILGVSMATARAGALAKKQPLYVYISSLADTSPKIPRAFFNVINGGKHAGNPLAIQEFMISPKARTFSRQLQYASEIYHILKEIIKKQYGHGAINVGDEGGFAPPLKRTEDALKLIKKACKGYAVDFAIDAAASEFYKNKSYMIDGKKADAHKLSMLYANLVKKYPLISIEDPFNEEAFGDFAALSKMLKIQVVGDDLTVTNPNRILKAIKLKSCNCLLLKMNQIGTITETINSFNMAVKNGWKVMVSHRSGETEDTFIADLSVGLGCGQIKSGAPCRGERTAKYNQLLRIEEELRC